MTPHLAFDSNGVRLRPKAARQLGPWPDRDGSVLVPAICRFSPTGIVLTMIAVEDYALFMSHRWWTNTAGYVVTRSCDRELALHNAIMEPVRPLEVDHVHGDLLDNRRQSLRIGTKSQNVANRRRPILNRHGQPVQAPYRGVKPDKGKYLALITHRNRQHCIGGMYATAEEAARAYDFAARERFGAFARLNFPDEHPLVHTTEDPMTNIHMQRDGTKLVLTIDLSAKGEPSSSGKTTILATTRGNADVPGTRGMKLGLNLYAYQDYRVDEQAA
jgi:hypothetical protein